MDAMISDWIARNIRDELFPGAVVALGIGERTIFTQAYGTLDTLTPATLHTQYDMASVSKMLATTMSALILMERGALSLADTLGKFYRAPGDKLDITIEHLMTHTSGMSTFRIDEALGRRGYSLADAVRATLERPLLWRPGHQTAYSCNGYIVLGDILEKVSAMPLDKLARTLVFGPLAMRNTGFAPATGVCAPTGWDPDTRRYVCGIQYDRNSRYMRGVAGNAGVFSTVGDLTRFAGMLAARGSFCGVTLLSEAAFREATRCRTPHCAERWGLGFLLRDGKNALGQQFPDTAFGHTGSTGTGIFVDAEKGFFTVELTNRLFYGRDDARILAFRRRFNDLACEALCRVEEGGDV